MSGLVGQPQGSVLGRLSTTRESPRPFLRCNARSVPQKRAVTCTAQQTTYKSPSSSTAATELQRLERFSVVVPDTVLMQKINDLENPKAATVSSGVLVGILRAPTGLREYERSIETALNYDKCSALSGPDKIACQLDKALINVGTLFAQQIEGRVSTEVDPRLAYDTDKLYARAQNLLAQYKDMGVPTNKIIIRIPGTWEGIQAAKKLEAEGIATHIILIYSFAQAAAAAQAGASVIQPNIGRLGDWYTKHPGVIRNPKGPREDSGVTNTTNPGIRLTERIYNYCQQFYPKTRVMVSGIRKKDDAVSLAGVDYLVVGPKVLQELSVTPTMAGYNDGLSAAGPADTDFEPMSPITAKEEVFTADEQAPLTKQLFEDGLGLVGKELLDEGLAGLVDDINRLEPFFTQLAIGTE